MAHTMNSGHNSKPVLSEILLFLIVFVNRRTDRS